MRIENLIAATYTPMKGDATINTDVINHYAKFLQQNGVSGAFVNGSTGDFASLTTSERKKVIEEWASVKPNNFTLINHVGHTSLKVAKELTAHSADMVDGISALAPYYFRPSSLQSLVDYCSQIAACAPRLPFYYYHIPVLTGIDFSMSEFLAMAANQIPNLAGIKFSKNDLLDYNSCLRHDNGAFNILFGVDEMFINTLPLGARGWVGSTYNHLSPLYLQIRKVFDKGEMELASGLQNKAVLFVETLHRLGGFNGAAKSFMKTLGVDCGPSRYPHTTLSDEALKKASDELERLGILEFISKV